MLNWFSNGGNSFQDSKNNGDISRKDCGNFRGILGNYRRGDDKNTQSCPIWLSRNGEHIII